MVASHSRLLRAIAPLALVLAAGTARADDATARRLSDEAEAAYDAGRYAEAAQKFEQARGRWPRPRLLWNLGRALRRQYDLDLDVVTLRRARDAFAGFEREARSPDDRRDAAQAVREADRAIADALASSSHSGAALERAPEGPPVTPAPRPPAAPRSPRPARLVPGLALIGVGLALGGSGMALGLMARSEARVVESGGSSALPELWSTRAQHERNGRAYEAASYVLYAAGGAAAVTGLLLLALGPRAPAATEPRVWVVPAGAGLVAGGRF